MIYARIGFEVGKILRLFYDNDFNWGYYYDHDINNFHCNVHPNNFVILPEKLNCDQLIAPLDYDMAFSRDEFLNIDLKNENYGKNDQRLFESYME